MEYKIKLYISANGKAPFNDWINVLADMTAQIAIDLRINRMKMGNFGNCKLVGDGVFELKIDIGPGYRIYFGKIGLSVVLLLCAGSKRTQKKDIEKAKEYLQVFKSSGVKNDKKNNIS